MIEARSYAPFSEDRKADLHYDDTKHFRKYAQRGDGYPFWAFAPRQLAIFVALRDSLSGKTINELVEAAYPDPDLEPDWAKTSVYVGITALNRNFRRYGWCFHIKSRCGRYRIYLRKQARK